MPNPIPVVLLGRLAVDIAYHRKGLGRSMVKDAALRVSHAAEAIGVRAKVVQAISEDARKFYLKLAFSPRLDQPLTLVVLLSDLRAGLGVES